MARLIDADALIEGLTVDPIACPGCPEFEGMEDLCNLLDSAPTVEPYPEELAGVIADLVAEYERAKNISYIDKPVAYALYQTWKQHDRRRRQ